MNASTADDEIFDDLHSGVSALRDLADSRTVSLSSKAAETLGRLENTMPSVQGRFRHWKQLIKDNAAIAAEKTDQIVHHYPWMFTLGALALGVLTGLALSDSGEKD